MSSEKSLSGIYKNPRLVVSVLGTGLLSGLLGIGGGVLLVPSMVVFGGVEQKKAHGTSLCALSVISAAGLLGYIIEDSINYWAALFILGGSWIGISIGTWILKHIDTRLLKLIFACFACAAAIRLYFGLEGGEESVSLSLSLALGCLLIGLFSGLLAGTFGVGGGIITVPSLILVFSFMGVIARGTSLLVVSPTALLGTFRNAHFDNVDLKTGFNMGIIGSITALAGSFASQEVPERILTPLFGSLLVIVALRMFWEYKNWPMDHGEFNN